MNKKPKPLIVVAVVVAAIAMGVLAFYFRAQNIDLNSRVFKVGKDNMSTEIIDSLNKGANGLEIGLVPQGSPNITRKKKNTQQDTYPGIYVDKTTPKSLQIPKLQEVPAGETNSDSAFKFRREIEEVGLYLLAGIKMSDPAIIEGIKKVPPRLTTINRSSPNTSGTLKLRTSNSSGSGLMICIKGSSEKAGTWYYYVPEARFALYDAARCP